MKCLFLKSVIVIVLLVTNTFVNLAATQGTTRAQAISMVRAILKSKSAACRINKTINVEASPIKTGWRVTAKVVMTASGTPENETLKWTVVSGQATPANQITSEVENGCP